MRCSEIEGAGFMIAVYVEGEEGRGGGGQMTRDYRTYLKLVFKGG